jgi:XTP/dITP diphosphohydrolase
MQETSVMEIIFATGNRHKLEEVQALFPKNVKLMNFTDIGFKGDIAETETTLEGNALLKARYIYDLYGIPCFADDTGLEVEALGGAPGVYSARYAGIEGLAKNNINKLLSELAGQTNRNARFRTVIAYISGVGECLFEGIVNGQITESSTGTNGFGYDPVFIPHGYDLTFAQMSMKEKNEISHRALAFQKFVSAFCG